MIDGNTIMISTICHEDFSIKQCVLKKTIS